MVTRSHRAIRLLTGTFAFLCAMPAGAQVYEEEPTTPAPAHLVYIDGSVALVRDGRQEIATINLPLIAGDRLRTEQGRTEVMYGEGSVLDTDQFTTVDFLSDELIRLLDGRVRLTIAGVQGRDRVSYRVDTESGAVWVDEPGEYRVSLVGTGGRRDVELVTIRGFARLVNELGETAVQAGERALATRGMAPSYPQAYNSASWDAFDRWAADRRDERTGTISARYLPEEIHGYAGAFDRYGHWRHEPTYGYVWYPSVHVGWRPYYHGAWRYYGPWGWTWIAYDPWWGWPTHHFGRWGFNAGVWFWIPARRWGPAHVYWATAPGYVGWAPLGWHGRPVLNIVNVNVSRGHDPWRAWTVVPRSAFGSHVEVRRHAVRRESLTAVDRAFVGQNAPPVRPVAASRSASPIYSAGRPVARDRRAPSPDPDGLAGTRAIQRPTRGPAGVTAPPAGTAAPRTTLPASPGALGTRESARPRTGAPAAADRPVRSTPRYRDLGPGGREPSSASPATAAPAQSRERSQVPITSGTGAAPGAVRRSAPPASASPGAVNPGPERRAPATGPRVTPPPSAGAERGTTPSREYGVPRRGGPGAAPPSGGVQRSAPPPRSDSPPPRAREGAPTARPRGEQPRDSAAGRAQGQRARDAGARSQDRTAPRPSRPRPR